MLFKIHKIEKYYIILFIAMMLDLGFFDLVNTSAINIVGIYYSDMVFLFCIFINRTLLFRLLWVII